MKIIVGSRGSKLALAQTNWVIDRIRKYSPQVNFEIQIITTKGDRIKDVALNKIGDKGLFTKELESSLIKEEIHMAVHSLKDMPSQITEGLTLAPYPQREDPRDVLVTLHDIKEIKELPQGAKLGTGSKRRKYQLLQHRPDLEIVGIRGNIDTRIKKIKEENLDGVILASAGINRLKINESNEYHIIPIDTKIVLPAPGQGILGIQIKESNIELSKVIEKIGDPVTNIQGTVERQFLHTLQGNCHVPIGAYCSVKGEKLHVAGLYGTEDGQKVIRKSILGKISQYKELGSILAKELMKEMED